MLKLATRRATQSANSYVDVDYANNYFLMVIESLWGALEIDEKEAALILASSYIDGHYQFIGKVKSAAQLLAWPRVGAVDSDGRLYDGIPERLKHACCELALEAAINSIDNPLTNNDFIQSKSQRVAEIETKVQYVDHKPPVQVYPKVDALLRPLIVNGFDAFIIHLER